MGHSTAAVKIGYRPGQLDEMVRDAVRQWYDEEADRYDNARPTDPKVFPIRPEMFAFNPYEQFDDRATTLIVPIAEAADVTSKQVKFSVKVSEKTANAIGVHGRWSDEAAELTAAIRAKHGPFLEQLEVEPVKLRKFVARATEGAAKTVYLVYNGNSWQTNTLPGEFDTMAEARAAALDHANGANPWPRYEIRGEVRRSTNPALVIIERPIDVDRQVTVRGTVTVHTVKADAKPKHAAVLFDYHH